MLGYKSKKEVQISNEFYAMIDNNHVILEYAAENRLNNWIMNVTQGKERKKIEQN